MYCTATRKQFLFVCLFWHYAFPKQPNPGLGAKTWHTNLVHASLQTKILPCRNTILTVVIPSQFPASSAAITVHLQAACFNNHVSCDPFHSIQGELLTSLGPSYRQRRTFVPLSPNPTQKPAASDSLGPRLQRGSSIYDRMIVQRSTFNGSPRIPNRCSADRQ
jgi:hypothetical protein